MLMAHTKSTSAPGRALTEEFSRRKYEKQRCGKLVATVKPSLDASFVNVPLRANTDCTCQTPQTASPPVNSWLTKAFVDKSTGRGYPLFLSVLIRRAVCHHLPGQVFVQAQALWRSITKHYWSSSLMKATSRTSLNPEPIWQPDMRTKSIGQDLSARTCALFGERSHSRPFGALCAIRCL